MVEQTIICPFCKKEIPLTQAITEKIGADLRKKLEDDFNKQNIELLNREKVLLVKEQAVAKSAQEVNKKIEEEVARKLILERDNIAKEAKKKAEIETSLEIKALKEDLESKDKSFRKPNKRVTIKKRKNLRWKSGRKT